MKESCFAIASTIAMDTPAEELAHVNLPAEAVKTEQSCLEESELNSTGTVPDDPKAAPADGVQYIKQMYS